jgi:hypothetical protein
MPQAREDRGFGRVALFALGEQQSAWATALEPQETILMFQVRRAQLSA